jgi:hypothetical protein
MRTSTDDLLIKQAREKIEHRLTGDARTWLDHPSTELSTALYKRGYWTFYCAFALLYIVIRQMPKGDGYDVRLVFRDQSPTMSGVEE